MALMPFVSIRENTKQHSYQSNKSVPPLLRLYSNRSNAAGSDRAARRAGKPQASAATIVNTETTTRLVTGSLGETPTSDELSAPPTANDRANPITSPIANRRMP